MRTFKQTYEEMKTPEEIICLIEKLDNKGLIKLSMVLGEYEGYFRLGAREEWTQNMIQKELLKRGDKITEEEEEEEEDE